MPPKVNNKYATNKNPWCIRVPWELCVKSKSKGGTGIETKRSTTTSLGSISSIVVAKQSKFPTLTFTTGQGCWNLRGESWVTYVPKTGGNDEVNAIMDSSRTSMDIKQRLGNYFIYIYYCLWFYWWLTMMFFFFVLLPRLLYPI